MGNETMEGKAKTKNGMLRMVFVVIAIALEVAIIVILFLTSLGEYAEVVALITRIVAMFLVLAIYSQNKSASIKMPWIILIMTMPLTGTALYLMIGLSGSTSKMRKRYENVDAQLMPYLKQDENTMKALEEENPTGAGISKYILKESNYPINNKTKVTYFKDASDGIAAQKKAMKEAKQYIFMEYFAIENGQSWREVEEILVEKVKEGVEVRVFYDDVGSIGYINTDFAKRLQTKGINCKVFNPVVPLLNLFLNNRDHRKITVIDGKVAFTGGYNIADEYFNITSPYGHWKDTGIMVQGETVRSMLVTFLETWNAVRDDDVDDMDISKYLPEEVKTEDPQGYVQFYGDSPIDKKPVGEDVYLSLVNGAKKYVYFITPYLIITDEMSRMLGLAAKRGVDVRIVTPGIPDKKIVYNLTQSYYNRLAESGVRIFEYSPGFCHAKMCVSDDYAATCGTINMDYRSLYHSFEVGCLMMGNDAVMDIKKDMDETMAKCREVTEEYRSGQSAVIKFGQMVLRLIAPLM